MVFKKYSSIDNAYRQKFIEKIVFEGHGNEEYYITEKIHGANFSFHIKMDGPLHNIRGAKRTALLGPDDNFHNYGDILRGLASKLIDLYATLDVDDSDVVSVYGEIFGGNYNHPNVKKNNNASRVQKGVQYSPNNEFMAFDVAINGEYIPAIKAIRHLELTGIPHLNILFKHSLNECLSYSNEFNSTIPAQYGLPELETNICEGVVIKPYTKSLYLMNGNRIIIKNKNTKFKEISGESRRPKKAKDPLPEHMQILITEVSRYCTPQRLDNVMSKLGKVTMKDFGKVMKDLNQDVLEEFNKDFSDKLIKLEKKELSILTKSVGKFNAPLIKKYFMENI